MLLALAFMGTSLVIISIFHNQLRTLLKLTDNPNFAESGVPGQHKGMGRALELIESGTPPDGYTCVLATAAALPEQIALVYDLLDATSRQWRITASTDSVRISIASCACPSDFLDENKFWSKCE